MFFSVQLQRGLLHSPCKVYNLPSIFFKTKIMRIESQKNKVYILNYKTLFWYRLKMMQYVNLLSVNSLWYISTHSHPPTRRLLLWMQKPLEKEAIYRKNSSYWYINSVGWWSQNSFRVVFGTVAAATYRESSWNSIDKIISSHFIRLGDLAA